MDLFSKANEAFVAENYEDATELYTQAIETDGTRDEFYANRAHAYLKLENYKDTIVDAEKAIALNAKNSKAYLRKGLASFYLGDFATAKATLVEGKAADGTPSDKQFDTWIRKCEAEIDLAKNKALGQNTDVAIGISAVQHNGASMNNDTTASTSVKEPQNNEQIKPNIPLQTVANTRYDWYQTETHVTIAIMLKNMKKEDVNIDVQEKSFSATIKLPSGTDYSLELDLCHEVAADKTIVKVLTSKIEVKMKKQDGIRWAKLEAEDNDQNSKVKQFNPSTNTPADQHKYPSSAHYTRDWDKLVTEIKQEEKEEKPEGDAALNQLFQQIYSDGSDEVKKAMNKSFSESGGTVLSTNWQDIGAKKTAVKPPDGMEYKKYDY